MRPFLALLLACIAVFISDIQPVAADHNVILLNTPSVVMNRVKDRGFVTYALDANTANYPGFRTQAAQVAQAGLEGIGIPAIEVAQQPDIWLTMPSDSTFLNTCGEGAAGCILYWTDPVVVYFRRALLYADWKTTIAHEGINYGHAMGQHERYFDSGGQFKCNLSPNPPTVMSCGTGIWRPTDFDRNVVWGFFVPDRPDQLQMILNGDWATVRWDLRRRDGGTNHHGNPRIDNATRVSFGWSENPSSSVIWAGDRGCGEEFGFCFASPGVLERSFDPYWSGCMWVRMENFLWWVPQASAPKHWTMAGCFGIGGYSEVTNALGYIFLGRAGDAACIGWYESLYYHDAIGPFLERGVMQIHPVHFDADHNPEPEDRFRGMSWDQMLELWPNIWAAKHIYDASGSWRPWATASLCGLS